MLKLATDYRRQGMPKDKLALRLQIKSLLIAANKLAPLLAGSFFGRGTIGRGSFTERSHRCGGVTTSTHDANGFLVGEPMDHRVCKVTTLMLARYEAYIE